MSTAEQDAIDHDAVTAELREEVRALTARVEKVRKENDNLVNPLTDRPPHHWLLAVARIPIPRNQISRCQRLNFKDVRSAHDFILGFALEFGSGDKPACAWVGAVSISKIMSRNQEIIMTMRPDRFRRSSAQESNGCSTAMSDDDDGRRSSNHGRQDDDSSLARGSSSPSPDDDLPRARCREYRYRTEEEEEAEAAAATVRGEFFGVDGRSTFATTTTMLTTRRQRMRQRRLPSRRRRSAANATIPRRRRRGLSSSVVNLCSALLLLSAAMSSFSSSFLPFAMAKGPDRSTNEDRIVNGTSALLRFVGRYGLVLFETADALSDDAVDAIADATEAYGLARLKSEYASQTQYKLASVEVDVVKTATETTGNRRLWWEEDDNEEENTKRRRPVDALRGGDRSRSATESSDEEATLDEEDEDEGAVPAVSNFNAVLEVRCRRAQALNWIEELYATADAREA
uniref:Uncharacterized protein n=1 Tax=Pseudictyota dubia TaxID=2749911 RepID=A0A7R9VDP7_9STRA|mmetsp:Transcript_1044/g.1742  ORF Transcript_1044/g.1742 Transcript_1044/m.1742 type:complete len:458 (+) Transcript_1044:308-1681(+)